MISVALRGTLSEDENCVQRLSRAVGQSREYVR